MLVVETDPGDLPAVGRNCGRIVGTLAVGERDGRAAIDADLVDFALERLALPVGERSALNRIERPSGVQDSSPPAFVVPKVNWVGAPPSAGTQKICR